MKSNTENAANGTPTRSPETDQTHTRLSRNLKENTKNVNRVTLSRTLTEQTQVFAKTNFRSRRNIVISMPESHRETTQRCVNQTISHNYLETNAITNPKKIQRDIRFRTGGLQFPHSSFNGITSGPTFSSNNAIAARQTSATKQPTHTYAARRYRDQPRKRAPQHR